MDNPFLARFDGEAALVNADMQGRFTANLNALASHEFAQQALVSAYATSDEFWTELGSWSQRVRPYIVRDGVLQIPVKGALLNGFPYQFYDMATGYEYIRMAFDRGLADPQVKGIALVFDTPGGMVAGNFDLVDHIYESRGVKPIAGFAQEHAYSAGYSLISAVDPGQVNVSRTGGVGSIGVVTSHVDMSGAMEQRGIKVTFIHAGKYKVEGNPYEALSDDAKARIQSRIDGLYNIFLNAVSRNRGMDVEDVRATEALTFSAEEAVSNGLADSVGSLEDAIVAFATSLSKEDNMFTQEQLDAAVAQATASAKTEGAKEEKTRVTAILGSDAAKDRPVAAMAAAIDTDMSVEQATAFLAKLPVEKVEAAAPEQQTDANAPKGKEGAAADFADAMNKAKHPEAGAPGERSEEQNRRSRIRSAAGSVMTLKPVK